MNRALQILAVVIFIALMVGINKFGWWISTKFTVDFAYGFISCFILVFIGYHVIQWLEKSSSSR